MNTIFADDPEDPLNSAYRYAIAVAQGGQHDNELKRQRFYVMQQLAEQSIKRAPEISVVECGCWKGHSSLLIHDLVLKHGRGVFHIFDSFEGLSEFGPRDVSPMFVSKAQQLSVASSFASNLDRVKKILHRERVQLWKGWIPAVFEGIEVGEISFAHIDVDLYQPTLDALHYVYPRLVPGGAIALDDYGYAVFPGATTAVDHYLADLADGSFMFVKQAVGSAMLLKR